MRQQSLLLANDTPGVYPPSYYAASANASPSHDNLHSSLDGEHSTDLCIVGGGLTGLSAAYHAAKLGHKVMVIEANRVGWGASGRNGGQLGTGQRLEQDELESSLGTERAKALWQLSLDSVQLCRDLIKTHNIDCDLRDGIIHADHRRRYTAHSQSYAEKLQKEYNYDKISFLDEAQIRDYIDSPAYFSGTLDMGAAHCHPLNFSLGIAQAALEAGVTIVENTLVTDYQSGTPVHIRSQSLNSNTASIHAEAMMICCNGYLDKLTPEINRKVMPINNYILATEPLSDDQVESLTKNRHAVADSKFVVNYFRVSADNRMLFGGGESYSYQFPRDIKGFVRKRMLEIYPQLANTRIDYGWGGTLAITGSRMPYFSRLDGNILTASGYSGHGLALSTYSGKILADAMHGQLTEFDLMANVPIPTMPGGSLLRWPILVAAMTYYSIRDRF